MKSILGYLLSITILLTYSFSHAQQRIGLVLSGGGATGLAHIGVLKALEERGIPIDYITGTSAGALVGSMYAAGYSPEEIESYVLSEDFQLMTKGRLKTSQRFLYKENDMDASLINFSFSKDSILKKSLPTNFITSSFLDFEMLRLLGVTGAVCGGDFDSLFIPFRCVASDITNKKSIVFSEGNLNQAVRASMTYPFYINPIRVNGTLLFDGGLYNNFPADIMYHDFNPDFIIGSNVSYNAKPPQESDLISQVTNMLVSYSDFTLPCDAGILIQPKTTISTFEFENVQEAIREGYNSTILYLDSIQTGITRKVLKAELNEKRRKFREKLGDFQISSISTNTIGKNDLSYVRKSLIRGRKDELMDYSTFEKRYFRLYATPQIDFIYPTVQQKKDSTFNLSLDVRKSKELKLDVGGHFSSRPVNTGYIGLTYRSIGKTASSIQASSYFGKFYGSAKLNYTFEIPSTYPISASAYFVMNRWDYFRSFATFFEDVQPSFLVQNEMYYGVKFNHPMGNNSKSTFDYRMFNLNDDYYQTENFNNKDTSDITEFNGSSLSWEFIQNSLNRKQFASSGHYFMFKARYVAAKETSMPGSTSVSNDTTMKNHSWISFKSEFQSYLISNKFFHLGLHGLGVFNSQSLFSNYTASLLAMSSFSPIPDAETFFLPEYRSPQHLGAGLNFIFSPTSKIDIRLDGYFYQPFVILVKNADGSPSYSKPFKGDTYTASASAILHTFLGPIRATLNYFPKQVTPLYFQVSYGYVLFNERAIR
ncbi:MAG: patatin-like phospholipase family protein [Flavobacteriia bacterium]